MTELLSGVEAPSDAELISRVRGGDVAAYGELFSRHVEAARRLGRQLVRGPDVDDLVSDAFAKTLTVLQNGGGPDVAFRAYVLTSVRRLHVDKIRAAKKVQPADDMTVFDDGVPFQDTAVANFENGAAARAFSSLPERWQLVLWHLEVEGQKPADIAPLLGMSANSVSALAYRAREGLRQAFLTMHLADSPTEDCRWVNEHLGAYVRKGLSKRDTTKVDEHLDDCRRCTAMYLELSEVNSNLAGIIAPLLLGAAAAGYVSSAGGAGLTGVSALFGRVRDSVTGGGGSSAGTGTGGAAAAGTGAAVTTGGLVTAGGVIAASVAAITAAAFVFGGGPDRELITEADQPVGIVQTPAAPDASDASDSSDSAADERSADAAAEDVVVGDATDGSPEEADDAPVSAADDAGIEPDGTTDAPADVTTGDAPVSGPGADAPGTGDGTVDGPGTAPGDVPGDAPGDAPGDGPGSDPGTDNPDTDEPGSDGPGSDPGTDDPGTDNPGTDEPGTGGEGDPQEDPPSEENPPPENTLISTTVEISGAGIVDGSLHFSLSGDPLLPPTVTVRLTSEPAGIAFAQDGACTYVNDTDVSCPTTPELLAAGAFAMPSLSHGRAHVFGASIPLDLDHAEDDSKVAFTVSAPVGYQLIGNLTVADVTYDAPDVQPLPTVTAALDNDGPGAPDRVLTVTVTGAPVGPAKLELVGPDGGTTSSAKFTTPQACTAAGDVLSCAVLPDGSATWTLGVNLPPGHLEKTSLRVTFESLPDDAVLLDLVETPIDDGTQQQDPAGTGTETVDEEDGKPTEAGRGPLYRN